VCSDLNDHTSVLKFLERFTGVEATNISSWRRKLVGDLTTGLQGFGGEAGPPVLPDTSGPLTLADYTSTLPLPAFPGADQTFPVQASRRHHGPKPIS
jgi:phospholipase C